MAPRSITALPSATVSRSGRPRIWSASTTVGRLRSVDRSTPVCGAQPGCAGEHEQAEREQSARQRLRDRRRGRIGHGRRGSGRIGRNADRGRDEDRTRCRAPARSALRPGWPDGLRRIDYPCSSRPPPPPPSPGPTPHAAPPSPNGSARCRRSTGCGLPTLRPASSDASFRRYLRIDCDGDPASLIVMDAPPPQEDIRAVRRDRRRASNAPGCTRRACWRCDPAAWLRAAERPRLDAVPAAAAAGRRGRRHSASPTG